MTFSPSLTFYKFNFCFPGLKIGRYCFIICVKDNILLPYFSIYACKDPKDYLNLTICVFNKYIITIAYFPKI